MTISVTCECGKSLAVKDALAGKRVKCPACGQGVRVAEADANVDPLAGLNNLDLEDLKTLPTLPSPRKKQKSQIKNQSAPDERRSGTRWPIKLTPKVIAGVGVTSVLGLAITVGLMIPSVRPVLVIVLMLGCLLISLVGAVVTAVGSIGTLISAFEEDVTCGVLILLVPFYGAYYMISRWGDTIWPKVAATGVAMTLVSPLYFSLLQLAAQPGNRAGGLSSWEGRGAPDLTVTTVGGETLQLSQLRGRAVILDRWATWCPPCVREIPHLERVADELPNDLVVVGVSDEDLSTIEKFAKSKSLRYPVGTAGKMPSPYADATSIPTTFFIDRQGKIRRVLVGYQDYEVLRDQASRMMQ